MSTHTLDQTAREAIASACADVQDATFGDQVDTVAPGLVARPSDVAQVAEVLRAATGHRLSVVPRGRGTKLSWGAPPSTADVLLDVSALDQVIDHAAGDLIVAAQAGTRLADVQQAVSSAGQRLALDETVPGTSIGGMLAVNTSGPRRVAVGSASPSTRPSPAPASAVCSPPTRAARAASPSAAPATSSSASPWSAPTVSWPRPVAGS